MRSPRDIVTALRQTPRRRWGAALKGLTIRARQFVLDGTVMLSISLCVRW